MRRLSQLLLAASLVFAACGNDLDDQGPAAPGTGGGAPSVQTQTFELTIANMAFSPVNLEVPPGATVTVVNEDSFVHSVTSEAAAGAFTPGSVDGISFDTGAFTGQKSFVIPSSALDGAVIPYYCSVHLGAMATPTGTITINAGLTGAGTGGGPSTGLPDGGVAVPQGDGGGVYIPGNGY
jgi:plastocyanin